MTQRISELKVIRDQNQFRIHFSASGFVQCGNVDICPKMGHIIPDGDGLHQPTNAADTSLYMQRLFIGADSAASKAQREQTRKEKQPAGKARTPECPTLCELLHVLFHNKMFRLCSWLGGDDRASAGRRGNRSVRMRRLPTLPLHCGAKLEEPHYIRIKVGLLS